MLGGFRKLRECAVQSTSCLRVALLTYRCRRNSGHADLRHADHGAGNRYHNLLPLDAIARFDPFACAQRRLCCVSGHRSEISRLRLCRGQRVQSCLQRGRAGGHQAARGASNARGVWGVGEQALEGVLAPVGIELVARLE